MNVGVKIKSGLWMAYFIMTGAVLGGVLCSLVYLPCFLVRRWSDKADHVCDWIIEKGIFILMSIQPWLSAKVDLRLTHGTKGKLIVSNHRSHLDTFFLLAHVRRVQVLAKKTLFFMPFIGVMMRATRQIPTQRGRIDSFWNAISIIRERLRRGETVHVFPEMTRCPPGYRGTQEFTLAPFTIAFQEGISVFPVVFQGTDSVWPKGAFGLRSGRPVTVQTLPCVDPRGFPGPEELRTEVRRRINEALA